MEEEPGREAPPWQVWVDTGGTFTDAIGLDPSGGWRRAKVLSTAALRSEVLERGDHELVVRPLEGLATGRLPGWTLVALGDPDRSWRLESWHAETGIVRVGRGPEPLPAPEAAVELRAPVEAPVVAAHLITGTPADAELPPIALRLATTLGTNALLERRGAPTALFVTRGFADLLRIGTQQRPDLFARRPVKPEPLPEATVEVVERVAADGSCLLPLDEAALAREARHLAERGIATAAVSLLHGHLRPEHERRAGEILRESGFAHVSLSHVVAPLQGYLARTETTVVDAYLAPRLGAYLGRVREAAGRGRVLVMTSAGGLVEASSFRPRDGLLSGPAGGVVGAAASARAAGLARVLTFDMGGTSTDVARWDGELAYVFEQRVGDARVLSPAVAVETVAAGGGSVCRFDGYRLRVGPESGGAAPGPACYGAGGPLCVTDVNLLLGRLDPGRFHIPIVAAAASRALHAVLAEVEKATGEPIEADEALTGFFQIANERMADAIREISVRRGYDPGEYALVAFGGAGGQHACPVAELLGIREILVPPDAGLLSAAGLGAAVVERFAVRQVLSPLDEVEAKLSTWVDELGAQALSAIRDEAAGGEAAAVRRTTVELRYVGQDEALEIPWSTNGVREAFRDRYLELYGYLPRERPLEVVALRAVASTAGRDLPATDRPRLGEVPSTAGEIRIRTPRGWRLAPVWDREDLPAGFAATGPALVLDAHSTTVVDEGWQVRVDDRGALRLAKGDPPG